MKRPRRGVARQVTGIRRAPSLYNWIRFHPGARKAQGTPICGHCGNANLWTESRFVTTGGNHSTVMRCGGCGKLSYFKTPKELQYGEQRMTGPDAAPRTARRRR